MFSKGIIISSIISALWAFFGGALIWGIITDPILTKFITADISISKIPDFTTLTIGCLITGFTFSNMYSKWARGTHHIKHGAEFGLWLGVLLGIGNGIIDHSTMQLFSITGTLINGIAYCLFFVIMGVFSSFILDKF